MVATISAGTTARYYLFLTDYYVGGYEPRGRWARVGFSAGIEPGTAVREKDFERLHAGLGQDGRLLLTQTGGKPEKVGGYDCTFSAPKSVSILHALVDDDLKARIEGLQQHAVCQALALLDSHAAFCRSGKGGVRRERVSLTVATFQHGEARPAEHHDGRTFADPQLHHHSVIMNLGVKSSGKLGALDGKALYRWKMAAGAYYHLELSKGLIGLGFAVADIGKNGTFEVLGVDQKLRDYFSARRHEIEEEMGAAGLTTAQAPALAAQITKTTRSAKQAHGTERVAGWKERATELGHAPDLVLSACRTAAQLSRQQDQDHEAVLADRIAGVLKDMTMHESCFDRRQLHAGIAAALVGTREGSERIERDIQKMMGDGSIIALDIDAWGHEVLTTPEMLQIEQEIGAMVQRLATRPGATLEPASVERLIAAGGLNAEQAAAVQAATGPARVTVIEGAPGSGKTTILAPIKQAWEAAGYRVIGSATAWRVAHAIKADLSIDARATDSWLTGAAHGLPFLDEKTVLIVDEAGLLSSRQMHQVLAAFEAAMPHGTTEGPRLILAGDRNQLQSVGAGSGLKLVAAAQPVQAVDTIQRQREGWARDAVTAFGKGEAADALAAFDDRQLIHEAEGPRATIVKLVDAWQAKAESRADCLMVAKTNASVRAVSAEVRRRLRGTGEISGVDVVIGAITPSGQPVSLPLAKGDRIRFLSRVKLDGHDVINGTEAVIEDVDRRSADDVRFVARVGTARVAFGLEDIADGHGRAQLAHAYAMTVHGAQGITTESTLVLVSSGMDRHDIYVAASRARGTTTLFVDRKSLDTEIVAELPLSDRPSRHEIGPAARRDYLARRLARSGLKRTTLDVLMAAEGRLEQSLGDQTREPVAGKQSREAAPRPERARRRSLER